MTKISVPISNYKQNQQNTPFHSQMLTLSVTAWPFITTYRIQQYYACMYK